MIFVAFQWDFWWKVQGRFNPEPCPGPSRSPHVSGEVFKHLPRLPWKTNTGFMRSFSFCTVAKCLIMVHCLWRFLLSSLQRTRRMLHPVQMSPLPSNYLGRIFRSTGLDLGPCTAHFDRWMCYWFGSDPATSPWSFNHSLNVNCKGHEPDTRLNNAICFLGFVILIIGHLFSNYLMDVMHITHQ